MASAGTALALLAALLHCGGGAGGPSTIDGGTNADTGGSQPRDDASDRALDVTTDLDANAPGFSLRGEWKPLPGVPSGSCLYATEPAKSIDPLEWEPCPNRVGCKRLKVTWTPFYGSLYFEAQEPVVPIAGVPHIMFRRDHPDQQYAPGHQLIAEVEDLAGNVKSAIASGLGALSSPTSCLALNGSIGPDLFGLLVGVSSELEAPDRVVHVAWSPLNAPGAIATRAVRNSDLGPASLAAVQTGQNRVLLQTADYRYGMIDTASRALVPRQGAHPSYLMPRPTAGGFLVLDWDDPAGLAFLSNANTFTNIYRPSGGRQVTSVHLDRSDGDRMVWVEGTDESPSTDTVYWTAPLTKNGGTIQPRRITAFEDPTGTGGVYAALSQGLIVNYGYDYALLTRISDGWSWKIPANPGEYFWRGVWVDDSEVWLAVGIPSSPSGNPALGLLLTGMVRFSRAELGAPTIPPS